MKPWFKKEIFSRDSKKYYRLLIVLIFLFLITIVNGSKGQAASEDSLDSGMILDCARRYYSVDVIKKYIDALAGQKGAFLQLHCTDNQNVGVECEFLGQTTENAILLSDGSYENPKTNKKFLSSGQIKEILDYAEQNNVLIIPEIDAPAHMEGFFDLAEIEYGSSYVDSLAVSRTDYPGELNISSGDALVFVQNIYDEYAVMFDRCRYYHIGCDEFFSGTAAEKASYINTMSAYMKNKGFTVRIWNDLLTKSNIISLDKSIQVTYWSYDGDVQDPSEIATRRAERASVPDLQVAGFDIVICNSYYLYYVPSEKNYNTYDNDYMINDLLNNWTVKNWDSNSGEDLTDTNHIIGSAVSVWSETSSGLSDNQIASQILRLYRAMTVVNKERNPGTYYVIVGTIGDGTAEASHLSGEAGDKIALKSIPKKGNHFKEWIVVSGDVVVTDNRFDIVSGNVEIMALFEPHSLVLDKAVAPTCEKTGLTEGEHCLICGEVVTTQKTVKAIGHDWSEWKVIKKPTAVEAGVRLRVCRHDPSHIETRTIPATGVNGVLLAKMTAKGKRKMVISWTKVTGAEGYDILLSECGKAKKNKVIKTIKGNKTFKWTRKSLKKKTAYNAVVKAYVLKNGKKTYVRTSPMIHAYTSGGTKRYTNAKSVAVKKRSVSLKKGKVYKIKAKVKKLKKGKRLMPSSHALKLRYLSSNKKIVTVSKSGKIKAKDKGCCKVYVLAVNGVRKTITIKVK